MEDRLVLKAERRTVLGKQVRRLRREGLVPAVVYGNQIDAVPIQLDTREADKVLAWVGGANLLTLDLDGKESRTVLVRDVQRHVITRQLLHADFYEVRMDELIRVSTPVRLVGTSPAVRDQEGVLVSGLNEIEVECLPGNLLSAVEVDLGELREIGDTFYVKDLDLPELVRVLTDPDEMLALIMYGAVEEVAEEAEEEEELPVSAEVEVIEKGKKEEEGE